MKLTLAFVNYATDHARHRRQHVVEKALKFLADPARGARLSLNICAACTYGDPKMVTQAFQDWNCMACDKPDTHHNGGVPKLCQDCAWKYGLCASCGGDIDGRTRQKISRARIGRRPKS